MTAKDEMEATYIFTSLTNAGYLLHQDGERWAITEPNTVRMPQRRAGLKTLRECEAWAGGVEAVRFVFGLRGKDGTE